MDLIKIQQILHECSQHSDHSGGLDYLFSMALEKAKSLPWGVPFVEIGTRAGGSALLFLHAIKESGIPRPLLTIDPYGKWYSDSAVSNYQPMGETRYREAMKVLSSFCEKHNLIHSHFRMTSESFMQIWDQVGLWVNGENLNDRQFGLVYLDGEHKISTVLNEWSWFEKRVIKDGLIIIDDTQHIKDSEEPELKAAFELGTEYGNRLYVNVNDYRSNKKLNILPEKEIKSKLAIVTICIGDMYEKIGKYTLPTLQAYAKKIGADFIKIDGSSCSTPHWEKFQLYHLLEKYDRIIYLDTDIIVRDDCPNLFDIVPANKLGMFNERPFTSNRHESMIQACQDYGLLIPDWNGKYYNSGVIILSKEHRTIFKKPDKEEFNFYEQGYINAMLAHSAPPIQDLDYHFNRMCCMDNYTGEERHASYIIHYAGFPNLEMVLNIIPKDIKKWNDTKPDYSFKKHILIDIQGGLGDQINCEPTIRFMLKHIYLNDNVQIKTHFPEIFSHLDIPVFLHEDWERQPDTPYYKVISLPGPETLMWSVVSNLLCHTVDYCSMAILHRTLPVEDKTPRLSFKIEDTENLYEKLKLEDYDLNDLVLVHPSFHWENKSFPIEWWQEVIDGLYKEGLPVCLIGKNEYTRGVLDVERREGMLDLRDKTSLTELFALISQAKVIISNDSSPIHIAGAFDNYIILIPTCKHESHLLPWRKGNQYYKACALYKRAMTYDFLSAPTTINPPKELNGEFLPPGKTWNNYLPLPKEVIYKALEYYNGS